MVVFDGHEYLTEEEKRLQEDRNREKYWKKWGPYVAERQWATGMTTLEACEAARHSARPLTSFQCARITALMVMPGAVRHQSFLPKAPKPPDRIIDFPHDHARSRAFRWGEDGIAGVSDTHGYQNIAFSFWNEKECVGKLAQTQVSSWYIV